MNDRDKQLKSSVMRRVRTIFFLRSLLNPIFIEVILFVGFTYVLMLLVSVKDVMVNAGSLYAILHYVQYMSLAFLHTRFVVQATTLSLLLVGSLIIMNTAKSYRIPNPFRYFRFA